MPKHKTELPRGWDKELMYPYEFPFGFSYVDRQIFKQTYTYMPKLQSWVNQTKMLDRFAGEYAARQKLMHRAQNVLNHFFARI